MGGQKRKTGEREDRCGGFPLTNRYNRQAMMLKTPRNRNETPRRVGRPCLGERAMTNAETLRRWRERHRYRLPWDGDVPFHRELAEWEASTLKERPKKKAVVVPLPARRTR